MYNRLKNILSPQNYSRLTGITLVIWLAHFQFGSGSGGVLLFCYLIISCIYLLINRSTYSPLMNWEKGLLLVVGIYVMVLFVGGFQLPEGLFGRAFWRAFDNPSRFILLLPLYFAWRKTVIPTYWLLLGAAVGISSILSMQVIHYIDGARGVISVTGLHISQGGSIAVLGSVSLIMFWLLFQSQRKYLSTVPLLFWSLSVISILMSGSRGALVGILLSIAVLLFLVCKKSYKLSLAIVSILAFISLSSYFALDDDQRNNISYRLILIKQELNAYVTERRFIGSTGNRILAWEGAIEIVQDNPLGVGSNNFAHAIRELSNVNSKYVPVQHFGHAHNEFFNVLAENGWPGLVALIALFMYPAWLGFRYYAYSEGEKKNYAGSLLFVITTYLGCAATQALFSHHSVKLLFVVLLYFCSAQLRAWWPSASYTKY